MRLFVWARETVEGVRDPGPFGIASCELSGQLLVYEVIDNIEILNKKLLML